MEQNQTVQETVQENKELNFDGYLIKFSAESQEHFTFVKDLLKRFFSKLLEIEENGGDYIASFYDSQDGAEVYNLFVSLAFNIKKLKNSNPEVKNIINFSENSKEKLKKLLGKVISSYYGGNICPSCIKKLSDYIFKSQKCIIMLDCKDLKKKNFFVSQPFDKTENIMLCFYSKEPTLEEILQEEPILIDEDNYDIIVDLLLDTEEDNEDIIEVDMVDETFQEEGVEFGDDED